MSRSFAVLGDGTRLAWRLDGPLDAPVLVLSHALGTRLEMWDAQVEDFGRRFRVLRYDARGHGESDVPPGAYSLDRLGRDVVELLDVLGLERVQYCGLSMGGMVGQWLGVRAPERIERLVLADTAPFVGPPAGWQERIEQARREGMEPLADAAISRWFTPEFAVRRPETIRAVRQWLLSTSVEGYVACCAALRDMDLRPTASLITPPALLIGGTRDPATTPEVVGALARAMPGHPRTVLLDAAHLSNVEQPEAFARAVLDFLT